MLAKLACANVRKSARDFAVYFITLVLGIAVFYAFNSIAGSAAVASLSEDTRKMVELLSAMISFVSVFIAVILGFLMIYANRFLIRRRNKEFALYMTLGMQKSDLLKLSAMETLIVGAVSLVAGVCVGIGIAQALSAITVALFEGGTIEGVAFSIAPEALVKTVCAFAAVFVITVFLNTGHLFKAKLIDLLNAEKKAERFRLRSGVLSLLLFALSCAIIGMSYKLLIENGFVSLSPKFAAATALVCVGTVLLFYSLSGLLLRIGQMIKPLYLRGLNMVALRHLSARANTAFASMSVIALTLFLAMTSVCGGIGICQAANANVDKGSRYDVSVRAYYFEPGSPEEQRARDFVEAHGFDMAAGLKDSFAADAPAWDTMVDRSAQIDYYDSGVTFGQLDALLDGKTLADFAGNDVTNEYVNTHLSLTTLSQVNDALELAGLPRLSLEKGECALLADSAITSEYLAEVVKTHATLSIGGRDLRIVPELWTPCLETTGFPMQVGLVVVSDEDLPEQGAPLSSILNIQCKPGSSDTFFECVKTVSASDNPEVQPIAMAQSVDQVRSQTRGLTGVVSYLALYIGFVLVIACASILAIQQLTDASDNARCFQLLAKLGASSGMITGTLFKEVAAHFLLPLLVGLAHTFCAMSVVVNVVKVFGSLDIGFVSAVAIVSFLVLYGAYFLVTLFSARSIVRFSRA